MERRWESFNGDRCCSFRRREVLCPDTASTAYIIRSVPYCLGLTAGPGGCFAATGRFEPPDQCKASPNWDLGGRPGPSEPTSGLTRERERERARRPSKMEPTLEPAGNHLARPTPTQPAPAPRQREGPDARPVAKLSFFSAPRGIPPCLVLNYCVLPLQPPPSPPTSFACAFCPPRLSATSALP